MPFIYIDGQTPKNIDIDFDRSKFEELSKGLLEKCKIPIEKALKDANLSSSDIDQVILVGGSTRIPAVRNLLSTLINKSLNETVNPDEVVAMGAAVQAGIIAGEITDLILLDVTPLSLGVETMGGVMTKIIARNTTVPTKKSEYFSTAADNQTNVEINVLQGEREFAKDNKSLGEFRLNGIPLAPRGVPKIEVTFDIDVNGILLVNAKDSNTGVEQSITIQGSSRLDDNEIDRMVADAESFAKEDKEKREAVDFKNTADALAYQASKQLEESGDKISEEEKENITQIIADVRSDIASDNIDSLKDNVKKLEESLSVFLKETAPEEPQESETIDTDAVNT